MRNRCLLLPLSLIFLTFLPFFSQADELKKTDSSLAHQGLIPDQTNNPNPAILNPSLKVKSGNNSPDQSSTAPPAVKIQEGTNAED